jgi:Fucosyltransferase, N-terminal
MTVMVGWTFWLQKWATANHIVYKNQKDSIEKSVIRETVMTSDITFHTNDTKYILLWTSFFDSKNWELQADVLDKQYFDRIKCNINDCVITSNRDLLPSTLDYDALLFHAALPWRDLDQIPKRRNVHQSYVMAILESPVHTRHDLQGDYDFFNMTMTYRLDSDVVWNYYGAFMDIQTDEQVAPLPSGQMPIWRTVDENFFGEFCDVRNTQWLLSLDFRPRHLRPRDEQDENGRLVCVQLQCAIPP